MIVDIEHLQNIDNYDSGIINDYGGGDINWWINYIITEIERCNEYWREQINDCIDEEG